MSKPLEIRLNRTPDTIRLYVDDYQGEPQLAAIVSGGLVETQVDWLAQIAAANAAKAGLSFLGRVLAEWDKATDSPEGKGESAKARREAFAEGLMAGLMRQSQPHPMLEGETMAPEWKGKGGRAFSNGWSLGRAITRAIDLAQAGE